MPYNHEPRLVIELIALSRDCVTPDEDFIISQHPASKGLSIATCGSFHGWKFLPVIGHYVVQMLEGSLEAGLEKRWAWDRPLPDMPGKQWPQHDLRELFDQA
jgi:glycine/D-amino acid oxidase-like deaminating enzyme